LGVPAVALPTLEVLSLAAAGGEPLLAVVDALRGEWFAQLFAGGEPAGPARIVAAAALADLGACRLVGHGVEALRPVLPRQLELVPAGELAPLALAMAARRRIDWSPATLLDPLYLRPAAIDGR
jgi:tRNA threonylcarbamoyladenosine biosynthesis protein TsaB